MLPTARLQPGAKEGARRLLQTSRPTLLALKREASLRSRGRKIDETLRRRLSRRLGHRQLRSRGDDHPTLGRVQRLLDGVEKTFENAQRALTCLYIIIIDTLVRRTNNVLFLRFYSPHFKKRFNSKTSSKTTRSSSSERPPPPQKPRGRNEKRERERLKIFDFILPT